MTQQFLILCGALVLIAVTGGLLWHMESQRRQIGKRLANSPRTVDVYRARLMRTVGASTTPALLARLLGG